jgi:hypothetical protein
MSKPIAIPAVSVNYAQNGKSIELNALGMRPMQGRAYQKRGEQYLLIKSPSKKTSETHSPGHGLNRLH